MLPKRNTARIGKAETGIAMLASNTMLPIKPMKRSGIIGFPKVFTANRYSGHASGNFECPTEVGRYPTYSTCVSEVHHLHGTRPEHGKLRRRATVTYTFGTSLIVKLPPIQLCNQRDLTRGWRETCQQCPIGLTASRASRMGSIVPVFRTRYFPNMWLLPENAVDFLAAWAKVQ